MEVLYCDLCGLPIKGNKYYILSVMNAQSFPLNSSDPDFMEKYTQFITDRAKSLKDVCPRCKEIIDRIFELRLQRITEVADEITLLYDKPAKPHPKKRKEEDKKDE